jgi:serine/threonine protein kinase
MATIPGRALGERGAAVARRVVAGRYAVTGELGRGGIGVVWRAEDQVIGRQVALKELRVPPGLSTAEHDTFTERVLREARTAGRLSDPSIVTVYDVLLADGSMFIVMELVEATTLADVVRARGPLPADRVASIGLQVLSALETAHAAGVVHRDVKPSNIMMLADGRVKLADFGIAQAMDDPGLTGTGGVMGSPGYMAPELFQGARPTPAGDLWSLGATLFHLVEGRAPFQRDTTAATIHAVMYTSPEASRADGPLAEVITGLLTQSPDTRLAPARVRELLRRQQSDDRPTEVLAPVALDEERTTRVDPDRTTAIGRRTTRPLPDETGSVEPPVVAPPGVPWANQWDDGPRRRRRRGIWLAGAVTVLVLAAAGVTMAAVSGGNRSTSANGPVRHTAGTVVDPAPTIVTGTTTTTAATTTTVTSGTTTSTPATRSMSAKSQAGPMPTTVPPPSTTAGPKLTYVGIERYNNPDGYHITLATGHTVPPGFTAEGPLGWLVTTNAPGTVRFYLCEVASTGDYFSSVDQTGRCEGQTEIAMQGYIYTAAPPGTSAPLYRCNSGASHFDSLNQNCEGRTYEGLDGYVI